MAEKDKLPMLADFPFMVIFLVRARNFVARNFGEQIFG